MLKVFWAEGRERVSARRRRPPSYSPPPAQPSDHQQWIEKIKELPDVRQQKVMGIRQALESGQYDLDDRLDELLEQLPDKLSNLHSTDQ